MDAEDAEGLRSTMESKAEADEPEYNKVNNAEVKRWRKQAKEKRLAQYGTPSGRSTKADHHATQAAKKEQPPREGQPSALKEAAGNRQARQGKQADEPRHPQVWTDSQEHERRLAYARFLPDWHEWLKEQKLSALPIAPNSIVEKERREQRAWQTRQSKLRKRYLGGSRKL